MKQRTKTFSKKRSFSILMLSFTILISSISPLEVKAANKTGSITLTGELYGDGTPKTYIKLDGDGDVYCIQKGKRFRNQIDDLLEILTSDEAPGDNESDDGDNLLVYANNTENFAGWGKWAYKTTDGTTHTLDWDELEQTDDTNVPSHASSSNKAGSSDSGTKSTYSPTFVNISIAEGWNQSQLNANSMMKWYLSNRWALQAATWAIEKNYIHLSTVQDPIGTYTYNRILFTNQAIGRNGDFIDTLLHNDATALKQYRKMAYKVSNVNTIPSFASRFPSLAIRENNLIHLKWDSKIYNGKGGWTATLNDENGILKYYDFSDAIENCDVTKNSDGTITISTQNPIKTAIVSEKVEAQKNFFLPEDGKFPSMSYWSLEMERYSLGSGASSTGYTRNKIPYTYLKKIEPNEHHNPSTTLLNWDCSWKCTTSQDSPLHCTHVCGTDETEGCTHVHGATCYHSYYCPSGGNSVSGKKPNASCTVSNTCTKDHYETVNDTVGGKYRDWQDVDYEGGRNNHLEDPVTCYIAVVTDECPYPSETEVEILLIADDDDLNTEEYRTENNDVIKYANHITVGEKYTLKYIYTYKGSTKGMELKEYTMDAPYYHYGYEARMKNNKSIIQQTKRDTTSKSIDKYYAELNKTNVTIKGVYQTIETAYPGGVYTYNSGNNWNDSLYIDAMDEYKGDSFTSNQIDAFNVKNANQIKESSTTGKVESVKKGSENGADIVTIVWVYETDPQIFTTGTLTATGVIEIGKNENVVKTYYDASFNYGSENVVGNEIDNIGDIGRFGRHVVWTENSEQPTCAVLNKAWQSDVNIEIEKPELNTGAGYSMPYYQSVGIGSHEVNMQLYYTINVTNPQAHMKYSRYKYYSKVVKFNDVNFTTRSDKLVNTTYGNVEEDDEDGIVKTYDTSGDKYEFDVNNRITFSSTNGLTTSVTNSNPVVVVDHIQTGTTYLQRTVPAIFKTLLNGNSSVLNMNVEPNYDKYIYEEKWVDFKDGISINGNQASRTWKITGTDKSYRDNLKTVLLNVYSAPNPKTMKPTNIQGSNNVNSSSYGTQKTTFTLNTFAGSINVSDYNKTSLLEWTFDFNNDKIKNQTAVRTSRLFFKYSNHNVTSFNYGTSNDLNGIFKSTNKNNIEKYYISQVLFKSNYTTKYRKELEQKGATYINEYDTNGGTISWIDMVNQNDYAIVEAGQGFELKVTVKYENDNLSQYLARYFGCDDASSYEYGTSKNIKHQYCNISPMTGGYLSGFNTLDRLATYLITGSNVYRDLYTYMSDNKDTVYSYSGIYDTPIIYDRKISFSDDYKTTTIVYTMKKSAENGVNSSYQTLKFYTNQLAPDSKTQGIIDGGLLQNGKHSITIWTPVVAATYYEYPNKTGLDKTSRYIGDAIELGYTIKTTGADDSIVHIVQ